MDYVIQAAQLLLGISILVILHEFGHFIAAKAFKTKVESFYLFFNPWFSLVKKKIGETEYGIGWLPLGGYVKIAGMIDESMDKEQMAKEPERLYCDQVAQNIGFKNGDKIIALNHKNIIDDITVRKITASILLDDISSVTVEREGKKIDITIPKNFADTVIENNVKGLFIEQVPFIIDTILPNKPASSAGFEKNDQIIAINHQSARYFLNIVDDLENNKSKEVVVTVLRHNIEKDINVKVQDDGTIGVGNQSPTKYFDIKEKHYGFFESIPAGFFKTGEVLKRYIDQFKLIFSKAGVKKMGGFGSISKLYGAQWVWENFWEMTALISVMLAVMNLLPIPALDGGHVMFLSYEMITGRKPHDKVLEYAQIGGMLFLLAFMLYANGMDVVRAWFSN